MGLNWRQFELHVLKPVLTDLSDVFPLNNMIYRGIGETLWHESGLLCYIGQVPRQPEPGRAISAGNGIASMELPTWEWLYEDWLQRPANERFIKALREMRLYPARYSDLTSNLALNVAMCRLRFWVAPAAWPIEVDNEEVNIRMRASYWWKHYNGGLVDRRAGYILHALWLPWEEK